MTWDRHGAGRRGERERKRGTAYGGEIKKRRGGGEGLTQSALTRSLAVTLLPLDKRYQYHPISLNPTRIYHTHSGTNGQTEGSISHIYVGTRSHAHTHKGECVCVSCTNGVIIKRRY